MQKHTTLSSIVTVTQGCGSISLEGVGNLDKAQHGTTLEGHLLEAPKDWRLGWRFVFLNYNDTIKPMLQCKSLG